MRIVMVGTGYVGLVSGTCFSEFGTRVICVDRDAAKVASLQKGEIPIFEPGLDQLVSHNCKAGRLSFTTDLALAMADADAVFIAVGTPARHGDGHADLSYVRQAVQEIATCIASYTVIVMKSTVPVGTGRIVARLITETRPDLVAGKDYDIASNPEFLREGSAIEDFMRPDRVVIGAESERAIDILRRLYRPLYLIETPILFTQLETSELIKYAANSFLATKITFINEIADLCEKIGADVHEVAHGIGLDGRIGRKFLHPGPGYGGSCFPKDTLALVRTAQEASSPLKLIETVIEVNSARKQKMAHRIISACGGDVKGKRIALLGLTFKPNTDDMRDSPSLDIIRGLWEKGAKLSAYDPEGMEEAQILLSDIEIKYGTDAYSILAGADVMVIITEWNQFRNMDLKRVKALLHRPVVVDLRNVCDPEQMVRHGFTYSAIGRPV